MGLLEDFTIPTARPLPVVILADTSGSMNADGKIAALNIAIAEMINAFSDEDNTNAEIQVAVITFGGNCAQVHQELKAAEDIVWNNIEARGRTPMGAAFNAAQELLENRSIIPSRAYTPTLVLASDGIPTDDWQEAFESLLASDRASKAARFSLAVGDDADTDMLKTFAGNTGGKLFQAHEARQIKRFFKLVTLSVASRTRSDNPNRLETTEIDDIEF